MTRRPFRVIDPRGSSPLLFICDHASNRVPEELGGLGLRQPDLRRHIAWDIGAAEVTEILANRFEAPAVLSEVSRLAVDCNRGFADSSLIPAVADGTPVPGNQDLAEAERKRRWETYHQPYHVAIEKLVAARLAGGEAPIIISIHSMTPVLNGVERPWQIALCSHADRRLTDPALAALRLRGGIVVGDNEPYDLDPREDYSVPIHALSRNLQHLQVEFRQDEIATADGQRRWAGIFGVCIEQALDRAR